MRQISSEQIVNPLDSEPLPSELGRAGMWVAQSNRIAADGRPVEIRTVVLTSGSAIPPDEQPDVGA